MLGQISAPRRATADRALMRAVYLPRAGGPDVLEFRDIPRPAPRPDEVLVRVRVTTVTRGDVALRRMPGVMWPLLRLGMGLERKYVLGHEFAGDVASVGSGVTTFRPGDAVFGTTTGLRFGSHAEYVCVPETGPLSAKPEAATYDEAAALPIGAMTALALLRRARVENRTSVLVYGASGSVGSAAVQLAVHFGATVTAVCGTRNVDLVRRLGATRVIDYTRDDLEGHRQTYDSVIDAVGKMPATWRRAVSAGGAFTSVRTTTRERAEDLAFLKGLLATRAIVPVIDRRYPLAEMCDAHRYVEGGHKRGNVLVDVP